MKQRIRSIFLPAMFAALLTAFAMPVAAQTAPTTPTPAPAPAAAPATPAAPDTAAAAPIYQGFPDDLILYAEADVTGDLSALVDFDTWESSGAVGIAFADFAARLSDLGMLITTPTLRDVFKGSRRAAVAVVDMTIEQDVTWIAAIDHANPDAIITALTEIAKTHMISFKEVPPPIGASKVYSVQVPEEWITQLDLFGGMARRRMWWGWQQMTVQQYSDPIYMSVWNSRYLIVSVRESLVRDALDFFTYADDTEGSLAGSKAFLDARNAKLLKDVPPEKLDALLYWNVRSTIGKLERMADVTVQRGGMGQFDELRAFAEINQFRYVVVHADYDRSKGVLDMAATLAFERAPAWAGVAQFPDRATPLTDFCPPAPQTFMATSIESPLAVMQRIRTFIEEKGEAVGHPEMGKRMDQEALAFKTRAGFSQEDMLAHFGGEQAHFTLTPYDDLGNRRRGQTSAVIVRLKDVKEAQKFIDEKLADTEYPIFREMFHHTSDRVFMTFDNGRRVGYAVYNAGDEAAWAWCIVEGCLIAGTQDAVRAAVTAKMTGVNLTNDAGYKTFRASLPATSLGTMYQDSRYLSTHAHKIFTTSPGGDPYEYGRFGWGDYESRPQVADDPDEENLMAEIYARHAREYRMGLTGSIRERSIDFNMRFTGLPNGDTVSDIVLMTTAHTNRKEARRHLRDELYPAVRDYLFLNGKLPATIDDFAATGGDASMFRDPMCAGPAVEKPNAEQAFVWLGNHQDKSLMPAVPMAYGRKTDGKGRLLLLMSDGSVHLVTKEQLDSALEAEQKGIEPPFKSKEAQTLEQIGKELFAGLH